MTNLDLDEMRSRAELCRSIGDWVGAERLLKQAFKMSRRAKLSSADCEQIQLQLAECLCSAGRVEDCERAFKRLVTMQQARGSESRSEVAATYVKMGEAQMQAKAFAKARNRFQKAAEIQEQYFSKHAPSLLDTLCHIARSHSAQLRHDLAAAVASRALTLSEEVLSPWDASTAKVLCCMAALSCDSGHPEIAEGHLERAIAIMDDLPQCRLDSALALSRLADLYCNRGAVGKAEKLYSCSIREMEHLKGSWCQEVVHSRLQLAGIFRKNRKFGNASDQIHQVISIQRKTKGTLHPDVATALTELAAILMDSHEFESAETTLTEALSIQENLPTGVAAIDLASTLYNFGRLYNATCRFGKSEEFYSRALLIQEEQLGLEDLGLTDTLTGLAMVAWARRRHDIAEPLLVRVLKIKIKHFGKEHTALVETLKKLAGVYEAQSKFDQAGFCMDQAHTLEHQNHTQLAQIWES